MTFNGIIYDIALFGAILYFFENEGWVSFFILLFLILLPLFSLLFSLPFILRAKIRTTGSFYIKRGSEGRVMFNVKNSLEPIDFKIKLTMENVLTGNESKLKLIANVNNPGVILYTSEHSTLFRVKKIKIRAYDILGLIPIPFKAPAVPEMIVGANNTPPNPMPDFSIFDTSAYKEKPGGGFSEIYEIREYRPGDPPRSIHWKLTAKTDKTMIRQPMEPQPFDVVIAIDKYATLNDTDMVLDNAYWLSTKLLSLNRKHKIVFPVGNRGGADTIQIDEKKDIRKFLRAYMYDGCRENISLEKIKAIPKSSWLYYIKLQNK